MSHCSRTRVFVGMGVFGIGVFVGDGAGVSVGAVVGVSVTPAGPFDISAAVSGGAPKISETIDLLA